MRRVSDFQEASSSNENETLVADEKRKKKKKNSERPSRRFRRVPRTPRKFLKVLFYFSREQRVLIAEAYGSAALLSR